MKANLHIIKIKAIHSENGVKIRLYSYRFKSRVTIPFNYECNTMGEGALAWLENNGFKIVGFGELSQTEDVIITSTFKGLK